MSGNELTTYIVECFDVENSAPLRAAAAAEHRQHILGTVNPEMAGIVLDEKGQAAGAIMIVKRKSEVEVRKVLEADPMYKSGAWSHFTVRPFDCRLMKPIS